MFNTKKITMRAELLINGELLEFEDEGLDIRLNNTVFNPLSLTASTTSFSYSFSIPLTKNNAIILGDVNIASKRGKFNKRYNATLLSDGIEIFSGKMKISEITNNEAKANLFIQKENTLDAIFGDSTLNDISWKVPFTGIETINQVNEDMEKKYFFPFVAYNLFNKTPTEVSDSGYEGYSDKKLIDSTCRFYFNSFAPSLNMVETVKKCFELKNLSLQGDIVNNDILNELYLSESISSDDDPLYNYGNPLLGSVGVNIKFKNYNGDVNANADYLTSNMLQYDFNEETFPSKLNDYDSYDACNVWNILDKEGMGEDFDTYCQISSTTNNGNMLVNGGIQIPADGYYLIETDFNLGVPFAFNGLTNVAVGTRETTDKRWTSITGNTMLPTEFQLLKFDATDTDMESLNHNVIYYGHYPNESKKIKVIGSKDDLYYRYSTASANTSSAVLSKANGTIAVDPFNNNNYVCGATIGTWGANYGYRKNGHSWNSEYDEETSAYYNSCGYWKITSIGGEDASLGKTVVRTQVNANSLNGYKLPYVKDNIPNNGCPTELYGKNAKGQTVSRRISGSTKMIIRLKKNEMLVPILQNRKYVTPNNNEVTVHYPVDIDVTIKATAVGLNDADKSELIYGMESQFDKDLNLANFLNKETKISDWIGNIQKAFNLDFNRNGNIVTMNLNKPYSDKLNVPINIDNRANIKDATWESVEYPSTISVKYTISNEEEGFYRSVPNDKINLDNWKDYANIGSDTINISGADEAKELSQSVNFSYTWYNTFTVEQDFNAMNDCIVHPTYPKGFYKVQIPIIGKSEWWIEGYKYKEMARYDGRSMTQRFWFRQAPSHIGDLTIDQLFKDEYVKIPIGGKIGCFEQYYHLTVPVNSKEINGETIYLDYNDSETSLLRRFFNVDLDCMKDSLTIEAYLTSEEYKEILKGRNIQFNSDIWRVLKIGNFPVDGRRTTKITLLNT